MIKIYLSGLFLLLLIGSTQAQTPTWSDDIASLVYEKCGDCHHQGGLAPFALMTYQQAFGMRTAIQNAVVAKDMPPWPPNDDYQDYAHKRSLTQAQIDLIDDWVNGGAPEGNAANTPPQPTYNNGTFLGTPDMQLQIPTYASNATSGSDDYVCFSLPTGLATNKKIKAIEVVPGNPQIVHHCLVYADQNGSTSTDTSGNCGGPTTADLLAGYAPGEFPTIFPNGDGVKMGPNLNAGSKIVLAMHYPEGSQGMIDSTKVNIFFYDDTVTNVRPVSANPVLMDWQFCINANTTDMVSDQITIPSTMSLLSIFPHAHLLGQEFLIYGVKLNGDTIPLIHIPKWDFEWQGFYLFKNPIKIPVGTQLYGQATYDNTLNNPYNPNNPPQTICAGLNTSDEMFLTYFQYLPYQSGDEFLDLDSLTQPPTQSGNPTAIENQSIGKNYLIAYPNPAKEVLKLEFYVEEEAEVSMQIFDLQGRLVRQLKTGERLEGLQRMQWDGRSDGGATLPNGLYLIYLKVGDQISTKKIMFNR
jgi:hypothetical protein